MPETLNLDAVFAGKRILFTGATGFVGKVTLSLLLSRYPEIGEVLVLVRPGTRASADERFFGDVLASEPFQPLRDSKGEQLDGFTRQKIRVIQGDVTQPNLGIRDLAALGKVDLILNCAGLVAFNPSLQLALEANSLGALHASQLAVALAAPLLHVSTCFVAGQRSGPVFEDEPILGAYPRREELHGLPLDPAAEIKDCQRLVERARETADDLSLAATFRQAAVERLRTEGRSVEDHRALRLAVTRERKLWLANELVRIGMERARHWGWPNTYTFTKALAEQMVVQTAERTALRYAIVRPSIVESALRFPFPGWNEGFTTSAPLAFIGLKGHRALPAGERNILDLIPVDLVAAGILGVAGAALAGQHSNVYQLASGDLNPFYAARAVELVGLYRRRVHRRRNQSPEATASPDIDALSTLDRLRNTLASRVEMRPVDRETYRLTSAPLFKSLAQASRRVLKEARPSWGAPKLQAAIDKLDLTLSDVEKQAGQLADLIELFLPFLWDNAYVFRCDNTRALFAQLGDADRAKLPWDPQQIEWRHYFLDVHMAGMETWVFPGLEEERDRGRRRVKAPRDLLELFWATTEAHATRVAFRYLREEGREAVTYARFRREALRIAAFLAEQGVRRGDRVLLCSENRPEWPIAFFGILLAGGVVVPLDAESTSAEVANQRAASEARAALFSEAVASRLEGEEPGSDQPAHAFTLAEALAPREVEPVSRAEVAPDDPASLIFTSGTTGKPKGVLLSHRNFAQLCAKLQATFDLGAGEGVLSVLPLHHTFEFSCGLLTPLAVGAEITYLDELSADRIGEALTEQNIHALVGVPALFQLLHRRLTQELAKRPKSVERATELLMASNRELRDRLGWNLGKILFWPIHRRLGGQLKVLVSGGSALSQEVHDAFRGLGFDLTEGYGLTEAAPVLTVTPPGEKRSPGSVGRALPGIELRIDAPDESGVGEVLARGPNVMLGYFQDPVATAATIVEGWLHTGDIGFLDAEGQLHLVGRKKDLILDASGKNIYPDELEELYASGAPEALRELSVTGLPDGQGGETVACLAVLDPEAAGTRSEQRAAVEEHFRKVSASLPFTRRIKLLHFTWTELPRTSTRKVRRNLVADKLQQLERLAKRATNPEAFTDVVDVIADRIALVARRKVLPLLASTRLVHELGFDSLAFAELATSLEQAGFTVPDDLSRVETVADLVKLVRGSPESTSKPIRSAEVQEINIPAPVAALGRGILSAGQRLLYERLFETEITGKAYIPQNQTLLVAANHASHLDMGLIKVAMGEQGELLRALAARDYFFDTPEKRAYFENFTRLIPMDRHGSLKASLRLAGQALLEGSHLLIFPEGTRSEDGSMAEFKPTLGFLALTHGVGILPVALQGTRAALPKGAVLPRARHLKVSFGPFLPIARLRVVAHGMSKSEGYRAVTQLAEKAVRALLAGTTLRPENRPAEVEQPEEALEGSREAEETTSPASEPILSLIKGGERP